MMQEMIRLSCVFIAVVGLCSIDVPGAAACDITITTIFGPETPTGRYKHPSCITELENGDLYLAYYGGAGEYAKGTVVFGTRRSKGDGGWTKPEVIASNPIRSPARTKSAITAMVMSSAFSSLVGRSRPDR